MFSIGVFKHKNIHNWLIVDVCIYSYDALHMNIFYMYIPLCQPSPQVEKRGKRERVRQQVLSTHAKHYSLFYTCVVCQSGNILHRDSPNQPLTASEELVWYNMMTLLKNCLRKKLHSLPNVNKSKKTHFIAWVCNGIRYMYVWLSFLFFENF